MGAASAHSTLTFSSGSIRIRRLPETSTLAAYSVIQDHDSFK